MSERHKVDDMIRGDRSGDRQQGPIFSEYDLARAGGDDPLERRLTPRSTALEFRSWLGWWAEEGFVAVAARILDISQGGVAVEAVDAPPLGHEVGFCLHPSATSERILGQVVGVTRGKSQEYLIRVAFWYPCPRTLYRQAIDGMREQAATSAQAPEMASPFVDEGDATFVIEADARLKQSK